MCSSSLGRAVCAAWLLQTMNPVLAYAQGAKDDQHAGSIGVPAALPPAVSAPAASFARPQGTTAQGSGRRITLLDGRRFEGNLVEQVRDVQLTIQKSDGKSVTVPWSIIASVEEIEPVQQSLPPLHVAPASPPSALPASVKSEETPSAMRSATPPSTTLSPNARQVEKGFVLQSRIATQLFFLNSQGATTGGLSGSLLLGYKMGRILLGIGCEYNNLTVSVPTANVATSSSNFLVIPTLQVVLIRSPDQRVELVGSFRLGLGRPVGTGASSSFISSVSSTTMVVTPLSLKYEIAPGVRFWAHPHLAVSALAGFSGEYYLFLSRISDRSSRGENSMAASLEVMGVF